MLREFISAQRDEILARARLRATIRNVTMYEDPGMSAGLPLFLDQLQNALRRLASHEHADLTEIGRSAVEHGDEVFRKGSTVVQIVHDYDDVCHVITELALERDAAIAADEIKTLNLCVDDAIASAVTEFSRLRESAIEAEGVERLGYLAHEMRNALNALTLSFASIRQGLVTPTGSTGDIHARNLARLQTLIDRSLADVRLDAGIENVEQLAVCEVIEEVEIGAYAGAQARGIRLSVASVDANVVVAADRQILVAAVANLLQNAFKFTHANSRVWLRAMTTAARVLVEVEDECGGLPPGRAEDLFRPFEQHATNRTGLGLGLAICLKAVRAMAGELRVRDLPGKGCIFTIDLPRQPSPTSIRSADGTALHGRRYA